MITTDEFHVLLRSERTKRSLTFRQAANAMGMRYTQYYRFENYVRRPQVTTLKKVCEFYNLRYTDYLILQETPLDERLSCQLKEARFQKGLTIFEAAKLLGTTTNTMYHFEAGRRLPTKRMMQKIQGVYGIPPDTLYESPAFYNKGSTYIARARRKKGYTQTQVAKMVGKSLITYSRYENTLKMPKAIAYKLCEILDIYITVTSKPRKKSWTKYPALSEIPRVWLRMARIAHGWNDFRDFAEKVGIHHTHYYRIEMGGRTPSRILATKIADLLEFDANLFYRDVPIEDYPYKET